MSEYYICDCDTHVVLRGALTREQAIYFVNTQPDSSRYIVMSRYALAQEGLYPMNTVGDIALQSDLRRSVINIL